MITNIPLQFRKKEEKSREGVSGDRSRSDLSVFVNSKTIKIFFKCIFYYLIKIKRKPLIF